jgi:hypothetical protein
MLCRADRMIVHVVHGIQCTSYIEAWYNPGIAIPRSGAYLPELRTSAFTVKQYFERPPGADCEHGQGDKVSQRSQNALNENDHALDMP